MARKRKGKSRLKMSTGQAKLLDSASGQVSFRYNMKYIYHCEYLVKEWDTQQYRYMENTCKIAKLQIRRWYHKNLNSLKTQIILPKYSFVKTTCILRISLKRKTCDIIPIFDDIITFLWL
jgi:hypothetical protein